jgi:hypothetical protein
MPVPEREDAVAAQAVDVLLAVDVPDERALAAPLDEVAIAVAVLLGREAPQVPVPAVDALGGDAVLLVAVERVVDGQLHVGLLGARSPGAGHPGRRFR